MPQATHFTPIDSTGGFLPKSSAGIALINSGIPDSRKSFWNTKIVRDVKLIYQQLAVNPYEIFSLLLFSDACSQQKVLLDICIQCWGICRQKDL